MNTKQNKIKNKKNQSPQKKPNQKVDNNNISKCYWLALAGVFIITLIIYFKATGFGYVWDDDLYIIQNSHIKNIKWENIKLFFTEFYAGNYQPITILTYAVEQKLFKDPSVFLHINNIIIHIINTYLVFVLIKKISPKNAVVALITAAFFAVHPMHVESVAWISERKDVLYSLFFLLSLIVYCNYLKTQNIKLLIYAAVFFILSCLSKSAAVVLP
ncbi:MAG: hypothetical protein HGB12_17950, partial [Bacteroidetes bacterium]|nr:hypothetical protein [Bacteroidota bacterium]